MALVKPLMSSKFMFKPKLAPTPRSWGTSALKRLVASVDAATALTKAASGVMPRSGNIATSTFLAPSDASRPSVLAKLVKALTAANWRAAISLPELLPNFERASRMSLPPATTTKRALASTGPVSEGAQIPPTCANTPGIWSAGNARKVPVCAPANA